MKRVRTLTDKNRSFKVELEVDYSMIETPDQGMIYPICEQVLKTVKSDNAKPHLCLNESHNNAKLDS